jgi:hypothetical protein
MVVRLTPAFAEWRMDCDDALANEELNTLPIVSNGPLPVLRRLPPTHILELIGREPVAVEKDAGALGALAESGEVEDGLIVPAVDGEEDFSGGSRRERAQEITFAQFGGEGEAGG